MKILEFVKLANKWFVWMPDFCDDVYELEMVAGADTLLDKIASKQDSTRNHVKLKVHPNNDIVYPHYLSKRDEDGEGATYEICGPDYDGELWLCNVTLEVFGEFPEIINFLPC